MSKLLSKFQTHQILSPNFSIQSMQNQREKLAIEKSKSQRADLADAFRNLSISTGENKADKRFNKASYDVEDITVLSEAMKAEDDQSKLYAAQGFRKILSLTDPHINDVLKAGVLPYLIE